MRKIYVLYTLLLSGLCLAQTPDHVEFGYDAAGNQIKRQLIDIVAGKDSEPKEVTDLTETDLLESDLYKDIKYYPNPVQEDLYVRWTSDTNNSVQFIEVYSLSGQLLKKYPNLAQKNDAIINFAAYPQGYYTVLLAYTNGESKTLKIVKR